MAILVRFNCTAVPRQQEGHSRRPADNCDETGRATFVFPDFIVRLSREELPARQNLILRSMNSRPGQGGVTIAELLGVSCITQSEQLAFG